MLFTRRYHTAAAGVVIGVASGTGLATLEAMGYGFTALIQSRSVAALDSTLLLRALLSPAGHIAWTGVTTAALFAITAHRNVAYAAVRFTGTFTAAVLLHTAWDGSHSVVVHVVVAALSVGGLLVVIHHTRRTH